nr:HEPN domain-containing protein [uncultured Neisseria sp.]
MNTTVNDFSEEDEILNDELDAIIQELDKMEMHDQGVDKLFNLSDCALELYEKIDKCKKNLEQLKKIIPHTSGSDDFLLGCLYCNICSALEGFVHGFISGLIKNEVDIDEKKLISSANDNLGRKKKLLTNINEIVNEYKNKTINNPFDIAILCNKLFDLNIKYNEIELEKYSTEMIRVRNSFTHNNGYDNGTYVNINKNDVEHLLFFITGFINIINDKALKKFDKQLTDISDKHGLNIEQGQND